MGSNDILVSLCFPTCNRGQMIKSILDHICLVLSLIVR